MLADFRGVNTPPWSVLSQSTEPLTLAVGRETQASSQGEVRQPGRSGSLLHPPGL